MSPVSPGRVPSSPRSPETHARFTAFSRDIALQTMQASARAADQLIHEFQKACLEEAGLGRSSKVWDTALPWDRKFNEKVAQAFSARLERLGLTSIEWWSGRDWKDMPGRYSMYLDKMYNKTFIRARVRWDTSAGAQVTGSANTITSGAPTALGGPNTVAATRASVVPGQLNTESAVPSPASPVELTQDMLLELLHQAQHVLIMQQRLVLQTAAKQEEVEKRAARAEVRAAAAERQLQVLGIFFKDVSPHSGQRASVGENAIDSVTDAGRANCANAQVEESMIGSSANVFATGPAGAIGESDAGADAEEGGGFSVCLGHTPGNSDSTIGNFLDAPSTARAAAEAMSALITAATAARVITADEAELPELDWGVLSGGV